MSEQIEKEDIQIKKASKKRLLIATAVVLIGLGVIFGSIFGFKFFVDDKRSQAIAHMKQKPASITAKKAKAVHWNPYIESVGQTQSINGVDVSAQVGGVITEINFTSGQQVKADDKLFEIQHKALDAQLKQDIAAMEIAKITYDREKELFEKDATSAQSRDQALAKYQEAQAKVGNTKAQIGYHVIRAPFSGKLGIRQINLGEYFQQGSTAVTLNQLKPIYVDFNVVGNDLSKLTLGQKVEVTSTAFDQETYKGEVTSINSTLSDDTRSLAVQATLPNDSKDKYLMPGMFVTVHLMLPVKKQLTIVPSTAVNYTLYGDTIFVLEPYKEDGKHAKASYTQMVDGQMKTLKTKKLAYKAIETPVKMGMSQGLMSQVTSGIQPGDIVVTSGQVKLKNGSIVTIDNEVELDQSDMNQTGILKHLEQKKKKQNAEKTSQL